MRKIINNILNLPARHSIYRDVSTKTLLSQTGYNGEYKNISVRDILAGLDENPVLADGWLTYSDDKRSGTGWYILDTGDEKYQVVYHPETPDIPLREYTDLNQACAAFIKQELEDIRRS